MSDELAWWDGWLGTAFTGVMLRELLQIVVNYLPTVPLFAPCSSDNVKVGEGGRTVESVWRPELSWDIWTAVFCRWTLAQLSSPCWRVTLECKNSTSWTRALVGVAQDSLSSNPHYAAKGVFGVGDKGTIFFDNLSKAYEHQLADAHRPLTIDVYCDLDTGRLQIMVNEKIHIIIAEHLANLGAFYPYVEFSNCPAKATISRIPQPLW